MENQPVENFFASPVETNSLLGNKLPNFIFGVFVGVLLVWLLLLNENALSSLFLSVLRPLTYWIDLGVVWIVILCLTISLFPYFILHLFQRTAWNKNIIIYLIGVFLPTSIILALQLLWFLILS